MQKRSLEADSGNIQVLVKADFNRIGLVAGHIGQRKKICRPNKEVAIERRHAQALGRANSHDSLESNSLRQELCQFVGELESIL